MRSRVKKEDSFRLRVSDEWKLRLFRVANVIDVDASDIVRRATTEHLNKIELERQSNVTR